MKKFIYFFNERHVNKGLKNERKYKKTSTPNLRAWLSSLWMKKITREIEFSRTEGPKFPDWKGPPTACHNNWNNSKQSTSKQATLKFQNTGESE